LILASFEGNRDCCCCDIVKKIGNARYCWGNMGDIVVRATRW
jgi:hypothetical protein